MHHAKSAAATMITDGWKSLEVCQAYLLLSVYPQPTRSWAEDRSWLYLGCAIRLAVRIQHIYNSILISRECASRLALDLNLRGQGAQTCANEVHEREDLNRTRTWLICFNMYAGVSPSDLSPANSPCIYHIGTEHWPLGWVVPPQCLKTILFETPVNGGGVPSTMEGWTCISATTRSSCVRLPGTLI
jgi:hypothetical protein